MPTKGGKAPAGRKAAPLLIKQESPLSLLPEGPLPPNLLPLLHNQLNLQSHQSGVVLDPRSLPLCGVNV
jgi:hypothetical protein